MLDGCHRVAMVGEMGIAGCNWLILDYVGCRMSLTMVVMLPVSISAPLAGHFAEHFVEYYVEHSAEHLAERSAGHSAGWAADGLVATFDVAFDVAAIGEWIALMAQVEALVAVEFVAAI